MSATSGTVKVRPTETTTYKLTAVWVGGMETETVQVTVTPRPAIRRFTANPSQWYAGDI